MTEHQGGWPRSSGQTLSGQHAAAGETVLGGVDVLMYLRVRPGARPVMVAAGQPLAWPAGVPADGQAPGGRYYHARLLPGSRLLAWARRGARFDLSRHGTPCVWLDGALLAEVKPQTGAVVPLDEAERAYLDAYLATLGRRWNDPDQAGGDDMTGITGIAGMTGMTGAKR